MSMTARIPNFHVLIPAAGTGQRTGLNKPKQHFEINKKSILFRTIDIFENHPKCIAIHVILASSDPTEDHDTQKYSKTIFYRCGKETRKQSVYSGLKEIKNIQDEDIILIHDAARPYLSHKDLDQVLICMQSNSATSLYKAVTDTILNDKNTLIPRETLKAIQTPQAFTYKTISAAHNIAAQENIDATDDASLVKKTLGLDITYIQSHDYNEKITTAQDMNMARILLQPQYEMRTGMGYDVHAFENQSSDHKLMLCGIEVPHNLALTGHSDADVGLHTITDALLGAIAMGDIGRHFPPSDPKFKNMDSAIFLEKARDLVTQASGEIINIDLTIICEEPKITPHAPKMIKRVADILKIDTRRISIKATTSEKLGFTGRKEGIAAQAIANIKLPSEHQ